MLDHKTSKALQKHCTLVRIRAAQVPEECLGFGADLP